MQILLGYVSIRIFPLKLPNLANADAALLVMAMLGAQVDTGHHYHIDQSLPFTEGLEDRVVKMLANCLHLHAHCTTPGGAAIVME